MIQVETTHAWNPSLSEQYRTQLNDSLKKLEQHTMNTIPMFGKVLRKVVNVPSSNGDKFGELFFIEQVRQSCMSLKEFVRKAVSLSKDIPRAVVACGCEVPVEIYKL
ncbi:hypothetical protein RB195_015594 [Necator americanus]|uniref:Uncharacterized protein n=1 Tax=Necator americanus TaxID=51031 RepID=A0ABR1E598_NECAM